MMAWRRARRPPSQEAAEFRDTAMAYKALFGDGRAPAARAVLDDLANYCCIFSPTYLLAGRFLDPPATYAREGRREVFLRIWEAIGLPLDELWEHRGAPMPLVAAETADEDFQ